MKPRTFFGLALLTPYLIWIICVSILILLLQLEIPPNWDILVMPILFYSYGIILWFIPYNLLALGMWFWGKGKTTKQLYRLALTAPVLLLTIMAGVALWISLPIDSVSEATRDILSQIALLGGFSLVFGYVCVGFAFGIYKILKAKNLIVEDVPVATQA